MKVRAILASASPRRRELLARLLGNFDVIASRAVERTQEGRPPVETAMGNALAKARDVASEHPEALVIGADTLVVLDGQILGKPPDSDHAVSMLRALSGRTHLVITGVAFVCAAQGIELGGHETSEVTFRDLPGEKIEIYVREKEPLDKAGAYGIQELGDDFVEHLEGDYDNVVGLPLRLVSELLAETGLNFQSNYEKVY